MSKRPFVIPGAAPERIGLLCAAVSCGLDLVKHSIGKLKKYQILSATHDERALACFTFGMNELAQVEPIERAEIIASLHVALDEFVETVANAEPIFELPEEYPGP